MDIRKFSWLGGGVAAGLALVIGATLAAVAITDSSRGGRTPEPVREVSSVDGGFGLLPDPAPRCAPGAGGIALVGRRAPGHTLAELPQSVRAIDGAEDDLVVFWPGYNPIPFSDLPDLPTHPALQGVGWLRVNAVDPSLTSCNLRLEDSPAASDIARKATAFMVERGLLTLDQIDGPGTTFQMAEDPTNPAHLFFTVVLAKSTGGEPATALSEQLFPYAATIDRGSGTVLSAGRAHWYDLQ